MVCFICYKPTVNSALTDKQLRRFRKTTLRTENPIGTALDRSVQTDSKKTFLLPKSKPQKGLWLEIIYESNMPNQLPKRVLVCGKHFTDDCFSNLGQYEFGLAGHLSLTPGSIPTLSGTASSSPRKTIFGVISLSVSYIVASFWVVRSAANSLVDVMPMLAHSMWVSDTFFLYHSKQMLFVL